MPHLLTVESLRTQFSSPSGVVNAVNGVSYHIDKNEIVGLVGESGCGKTASQLSVLQLISHPGRIIAGKVLFEGKNLLELPAKGSEMRAIRGGKIGMVFQEPSSSLNPVRCIGSQITEMLEAHTGLNRKAAKERAIELLNQVRIPDARKRFKDYPHQLSGGMLQRVMISIALSCAPKVLIADEPTSALDVTTQARVLELMKDLVVRYQTSLLLVTHNLGILPKYAQRVYVMYAGQIVESGAVKDVFGDPRHPYTRGLLKCVLGPNSGRRSPLSAIKGSPPDLVNLSATCAFLPRCEYGAHACTDRPAPPLIRVKDQHYMRCYGEV